ncbi:MAG: alpha/beta hydrolase, partial [Acidobacteriota bacterium]|nr:alpha/beta hydrolase [Acidobacteriota bacterium]
MRDIDVHLPDRRLWGRWLNESAHAVAPGIPTIVFLHEGLGSVGLWREFPEAVCRRAGLRGFAYDRTGYGRSSPWPVEPDRNYMAVEGDHVLPQLLDAARIGTCVLVGHSDGGTIALNYASAQPSMLRGVVTIGAHVISEPRTLDAIRLARA